MTIQEDSVRLRKLIYALLITVAAGAAVGRIMAAERVYEPTLYSGKWPEKAPPALPTFSSNDRARWATVRALVDHGTYAIGERVYRDGEYSDRVVWQEEGWDPGWDTVDKALHPETKKFYSTKPPLLPTILAGWYWLLQSLTGWTMADNIWAIVRLTLVLINVLPFVLYLYLLSLLVERFGQTDWCRLFVMTAACFATLVTPFLVTLNNHTISTFSVLFALYAGLRIWCGDEQGARQGDRAPWYLFVIAGFFASFAVCNELPAAAFAAGLMLMLLWRAPKRTLLFFLPVAVVPIAAFFITNWLAIGQLRPIQTQFGSEWYQFEGSHWRNPDETKSGIDFAGTKETRGEYAFHVLLGHHGWFSLTPMWVLAVIGMFLGLKRPSSDSSADARPRQSLPWWFFPCSFLLSLVVIGFYLVMTTNYSGWSSGLRWLMWLTPLWLLCMLPVLDRLAYSRWRRGFAYSLLLLSVMSVSYPAWNPWRHPWIYRLLDAYGWIPY